jgi:lipoprotein-releasing system permease protein
VYSPKCVMSSDEIHLPEELEVAGIFELGMWEFDRRFLMTSIETARELYGIESGAREIRIAAVDPEPEAAELLALAIEDKLGPAYTASTWMDMKAALFSALRVEKNLMRFLLACIAVVAFFCVANTLIVITVQKTGAIGLLKSLGFSGFRIMGVFMWHGMIQCMTGTVTGVGVGMLVLKYRENLLQMLKTQFDYELFPQEIYMLDKLPSATTLEDVMTIAGLVITFCLIATVIPAARAASLDPVEALRSE